MQIAYQTSIENNGQHERPMTSCPHLGVIDDPGAWLNFPNAANLCYLARPPQPAVLNHQTKFCLSADHSACVVFNRTRRERLPADIGLILPIEEKPAYPKWLAAAALAMVLIGALLLVVLTRNGSKAGASDVDQTPNAALLIPANQTPTADQSHIQQTQLAALPSPTSIVPTAKPSYKPSPTPKPTATVVPTPTVAPTHFAEFGEPFGPDQAYVLYKLKDGESLENVAQVYNTKGTVIRAANILIEGASVKPGTVLLLMPGVKDPAVVIKFQVVQVMAPTLPKHVAAEYNITVEILVQYNLIDPELVIPGGRWLIFPAVS